MATAPKHDLFERSFDDFEQGKWSKMELSDNSRTIFMQRYSRRDEHGNPGETPEQTVFRVSRCVAAVEETPKERSDALCLFYHLIASKKFLPNTPTFTGAGTPLGQLAACFVLPIVDDLGKHPQGIMSTLRDASLVQQTGGGNGFSFSRLRQKGARVNTSAGTSTGPVGFLEVYDRAFGTIAQGGTRRGANMAVLRVDHPDIREFIDCKRTENSVTNFNISVGITDDFMKAVRDGRNYNLVAPHTKEIIETIPAREIFDKIVLNAHRNGEPGVLFLDTANGTNPVPHLYTLETTNPCGEQWLGPYENCCLGSINLIQHVLNGKMDWGGLQHTIIISTRFLDNVVSANNYVPSVPQLKEAAEKVRRLGLGIMGLADCMIACGVAYGSKLGEEFASQIMEFVQFHSMRMSCNLAEKKGSFPEIRGSLFDPTNFTWQIPKPLEGVTHETDFGRPVLDWEGLVNDVKIKGIRNAARTTIAPTGTIATVSGCKGYGCEPLFALAYVRHVNNNGKDLILRTTNEQFEEALVKGGYSQAQIESITKQATYTGSCQTIAELGKEIKDVFVVAGDVQPRNHVRMQAALQAFVDNSISKTCNLPSDATVNDVSECYFTAWKLRCKGITVYVTGSRETVVIETEQEIQRKLQKANENSTQNAPAQIVPLQGDIQSKIPRPKYLRGATYVKESPTGKLFTTLNSDEDSNPFEVFINTAKAGTETSAVSEAIGRLISYILRMQSPVPQQQRLMDVINQLIGIGGRRTSGYGANKTLSMADTIAKSLNELLILLQNDSQNVRGGSNAEESTNDSLSVSLDTLEAITHQIGDICPDCGIPSFIDEENCKTCYDCGYSECG